MSRLFEIHDSRGSSHCSENDLPLTVGTAADSHIFLEYGEEIEGYLDDSKGHLFFQPADSAAQVFHNNQLISASTWIKSDDTIRIGKSFLHYYISGDLVKIRVTTDTRQTLIKPPDDLPPESLHTRRNLPRNSPETKGKQTSGTVLRRLIGAVLLTLLIIAGFTLTAKPLEVTVSPEPDSLSISGFPPVLHLGRSFLGLKGEYTLKANKEGYQPIVSPVVIADKTASRYTFTFKKLPGLVTIRTAPVEGATVVIDGVNVGLSPLINHEISPGEHQIRLIKDRFLVFEQTINVEGKSQKQHFDLSLLPAWSEVSFRTEPAGAAVSINGEAQGHTPLTLELLTGQYTILFSKETYSNSRIQLEVPAGDTLKPETIVMTLAPATLELTSSPQGGTVTIDSVFQGQTPLTLKLDSTIEHTVLVSKQGFKDLHKKISLKPDETKELFLRLQPEYGIIFLTTEPPDAELYLDGKRQDRETGRLELDVRKHTFEIRAKGYITAVRHVTPSKELSRQVEIRLKPVPLPGQPEKSSVENKAKNSLEMILLQPASFQMGASRREAGRRANERIRKVRITRPYYLGVREITNGEFKRFRPGHSSGVIGGYSLDDDKQPVVNVSRDDAVRYLNWLSTQDGFKPFYREEKGSMVTVDPMTDGYRLPFESEWAYAARYSNRQAPLRYPWSGSFPPPQKSGNFADESSRALLPVVIRGYNDSFPVSAAVAHFPKNMGGFFDIGGNVSEWCHDLYHPYTGFSQKEMVDPVGPATGTHHVVRGSSWRDGSITELRLSYRSYSNRGHDDLGFRAARFAE